MNGSSLREFGRGIDLARCNDEGMLGHPVAGITSFPHALHWFVSALNGIPRKRKRTMSLIRECP